MAPWTKPLLLIQRSVFTVHRSRPSPLSFCTTYLQYQAPEQQAGRGGGAQQPRPTLSYLSLASLQKRQNQLIHLSVHSTSPLFLRLLLAVESTDSTTRKQGSKRQPIERGHLQGDHSSPFGEASLNSTPFPSLAEMRLSPQIFVYQLEVLNVDKLQNRLHK